MKPVIYTRIPSSDPALVARAAKFGIADLHESLGAVAGQPAIFRLPAAAYPNIAPPQINISAGYPGANADTVEQAVTQVIGSAFCDSPPTASMTSVYSPL